MLYSLVYVSTAVVMLPDELLSHLLEKATLRNSAFSVTGLLLYSDGSFMQCLEGSKESISLLMRYRRSGRRYFGVNLYRIPVSG
jgi:hypothetical protein